MSIGPIEAIGGGYVPLSLDATSATSAASAGNGSGGADFANMLNNSVQNVEAAQDRSDNLAVRAATGTLADVHEYMIAANEAQLTTQLTVAVRNKALEAFSEIMRLQA